MMDQKDNGKQETKKRPTYAAVGLVLGAAVGFSSGGAVAAGIGAAIGLLLGAAIDSRRA
jgi:outer membrane lipoprotein SlyB